MFKKNTARKRGISMDRIQSAANPLIKRLRSLREAKARAATGEFLVEGEVMIREALSCGLIPTDALAEAESALTQALSRAGARVRLADRRAIEAACDTQTPQGVCAAFGMPANTRVPEDARLVVALDGVQDPGNVGTILRTADAAGFDAILLTGECADPYSPKVQRASMGSGFRVPMAAAAFPEALCEFQKKGFRVIVSSLDGDPLYSRAPSREDDRLILVVGNEARGVSRPVQAIADERVKIPMRGRAESLNAAVAAGILMYELTRGRQPRAKYEV